MKTRALIFLLTLFGLSFGRLQAEPAAYPDLKAKAEAFYTEHSYAKANEVYKEAAKLELTIPESRWVDFRLADTLWRSASATQNSDNSQFENAQQKLEALIRDLKLTEDHDRVWAEVHESLGDFFWTRRYVQNWGEAWPHYQAALDWWAGAADINQARARYLKLIWSITDRPAWRRNESYYYYWNYGGALPMEFLENALKIAKEPNDLAHAHYLIAMMLHNQGGDWEQLQRTPEEFEGAITLGKSTDWYGNALYNYAVWMENGGRVITHKDGSWTQEPDYVKALELFRRFVKEFKKGESEHYDEAQQQIKNITDPSVSVNVANIFLPDSEIQYGLNWRNLKRIDLTLYSVDLTRDVQLDGDDSQHNDWLQSINLAGRKKIKSWSRDTKDTGEYKPGSETIRMDGKLPVGAYVLEARGEGANSRALLLVTEASVVLKTSGRQALVYVCDAMAGSPLAEARVRIWERYYENDHWHWHEAAKTADTNGIAVFDLLREAGNEQIFAGALSKSQQAFSAGNTYRWNRNLNDQWRIYAYTDRPAYRPTETAQWKFFARRMDDSGAYLNPANEVVEYQINDPRGAKLKEDKVTLNAFGSAWGSVELKENAPLGEYSVIFWNQGRTREIGRATLFRMEEYKLPEFKVTVQTPEENGRKKTFRLGEKVEASVQADYYFGGAVANASVEVIVYQDPYYHYWHRPHEFSWFYDDMTPEAQSGRYRGGGQIIKRETIKTDATGKAALTFETPRNAGQDFEYRIEARVTDASRREIVGNGTVRVTGQRYYVTADAAHNLYRPQDKVEIDFKALDANDQPVITEGTVKVTRERWVEVWLDSKGREVRDVELKNWRTRSLIFPPPPSGPNDRPWRLKFRGYEADDILTRTLKADTNGAAQLVFTPEREGFYRIAWTSPDNGPTNARPAPPIQSQTTVWVAKDATTDLGYRQGGVEIIVDQDTFRVGETTPVMISVPTNDRYVLFTVEGADLYDYQLIHVTGTVKLVELPVQERHVPNIFLSAALVSDHQIYTDSKQVIVPPTKNFLTLEVTPDRNQYQPREPGIFTITARDDQNKPVAAEVSFGLVDESVYYIQSDYAGDPRQFYFGEKRPQLIQTQSTFDQRTYAQLVVGENDQLMDKRDLELFKKRRFRSELQSSLSEDASDVLAVNGLDRSMEKDAETGLYDRSSSSRMMTRRMTFSGGSGDGRAFGATFAVNSVLAPASAPVAMAKSIAGYAELGAKGDRQKIPAEFPAPGQASEPAVQVRSDFRSTILWQPDVMTGKDGKATVQVTYPDSLTGWKATVRGVTTANQFGIAVANTRTKQPLIVRLEAPRFFVVGDTVTISAVVNNNTDQELKVEPQLDLGGVLSDLRLEPAATLTVPANGEARADWVMKISTPGEAKLKVTARGGKYADAMEKSYTIYEHGIEKYITKSGKVRGDDITVSLELPKERKADSTSLAVQITPSMAVTMLDALPYLIHYPYGCTEQTMSRFLPAAMAAKTLKDLGLKPEDVMGHLFGGIEPASAAATHPQGSNDFHELDEITRQSLERLYDFQHPDGGWGWWKPGDSDNYMTAYVVWGLSLAHDAGISLKSGVLRNGADYLRKQLVDEKSNFDTQAWMLHALSCFQVSIKKPKVGDFEVKAFDNLWTNRDQLNAYTRSLLALSAHNYGFNDQAKILVANLENGVKIDTAPDTSVLVKGASQTNSVIGTAHWGEDGVYWRWSDGGVEATAFALRALLAIEPTNHLVEPVSNWLIKNRRGAQWSNTRDTAITVLAMNDYLRATGELTPNLEYELLVNDHAIATNKISGADIFKASSRFAIDAKLIRDGTNEIHIVRKSGTGSIYFAANAEFFSLEEPIAPVGHEIFVKRQYYKLVGRPTLLKGYVYEREPLNDGGSVKSGDRVETVLIIEAKNNYEYLLFEDLKPAGFEAVEVRSGEALYAYELKSNAVDRKFGTNTTTEPSTPSAKATAKNKRRVTKGLPSPTRVTDEDHTGRSRWVYQELRDRKVALFIDKLPQGIWEIKYDLRAETPGEFHALPVMGQAMYVPEIRCNGAEVRIKVEEGEP